MRLIASIFPCLALLALVIPVLCESAYDLDPELDDIKRELLEESKRWIEAKQKRTEQIKANQHHTADQVPKVPSAVDNTLSKNRTSLSPSGDTPENRSRLSPEQGNLEPHSSYPPQQTDNPLSNSGWIFDEELVAYIEGLHATLERSLRKIRMGLGDASPRLQGMSQGQSDSSVLYVELKIRQSDLAALRAIANSLTYMKDDLSSMVIGGSNNLGKGVGGDGVSNSVAWRRDDVERLLETTEQYVGTLTSLLQRSIESTSLTTALLLGFLEAMDTGDIGTMMMILSIVFLVCWGLVLAASHLFGTARKLTRCLCCDCFSPKNDELSTNEDDKDLESDDNRASSEDSDFQRQTNARWRGWCRRGSSNSSKVGRRRRSSALALHREVSPEPSNKSNEEKSKMATVEEDRKADKKGKKKKDAQAGVAGGGMESQGYESGDEGEGVAMEDDNDPQYSSNHYDEAEPPYLDDQYIGEGDNYINSIASSPLPTIYDQRQQLDAEVYEARTALEKACIAREMSMIRAQHQDDRLQRWKSQLLRSCQFTLLLLLLLVGTISFIVSVLSEAGQLQDKARLSIVVEEDTLRNCAKEPTMLQSFKRYFYNPCYGLHEAVLRREYIEQRNILHYIIPAIINIVSTFVITFASNILAIVESIAFSGFHDMGLFQLVPGIITRVLVIALILLAIIFALCLRKYGLLSGLCCCCCPSDDSSTSSRPVLAPATSLPPTYPGYYSGDLLHHGSSLPPALPPAFGHSRSVGSVGGSGMYGALPMHAPSPSPSHSPFPAPLGYTNRAHSLNFTPNTPTPRSTNMRHHQQQQQSPQLQVQYHRPSPSIGGNAAPLQTPVRGSQSGSQSGSSAKGKGGRKIGNHGNGDQESSIRPRSVAREDDQSVVNHGQNTNRSISANSQLAPSTSTPASKKKHKPKQGSPATTTTMITPTTNQLNSPVESDGKLSGDVEDDEGLVPTQLFQKKTSRERREKQPEKVDTNIVEEEEDEGEEDEDESMDEID